MKCSLFNGILIMVIETV